MGYFENFQLINKYIVYIKPNERALFYNLCIYKKLYIQ